jgi:hypothetical protein
MERIHVVVKGTEVTRYSSEMACEKAEGIHLQTLDDVKSAIEPLSGPELTALYNSLTGITVKRFASKDAAAKRIYRFVNPALENSTKQKEATMAKKKATKKKTTKKTATKKKAAAKSPGRKSKVMDQTIHVLDHPPKSFQEGSVRKQCYEIIMKHAERKRLAVSDYIQKTSKAGIDDGVAVACLKKLAVAGQKNQTVELV